MSVVRRLVIRTTNGWISLSPVRLSKNKETPHNESRFVWHWSHYNNRSVVQLSSQTHKVVCPGAILRHSKYRRLTLVNGADLYDVGQARTAAGIQ